MAVRLQRDGKPRPHLALAGDTSPAFEVKPVRAEALAACLNSLHTGELASADEVTAFEVLIAAAFDKGYAEAQRDLAEVS
jgi:predicted dinucleotide-binding enzyme